MLRADSKHGDNRSDAGTPFQTRSEHASATLAVDEEGTVNRASHSTSSPSYGLTIRVKSLRSALITRRGAGRSRGVGPSSKSSSCAITSLDFSNASSLYFCRELVRALRAARPWVPKVPGLGRRALLICSSARVSGGLPLAAASSHSPPAICKRAKDWRCRI